ncbi:uncharacterized protein AB675_2328 [Cyphellophora attinorum]|uniref:Uncharacterized protein n=1 Tax=Cyphellophora attinorum TaxID=1664694 RepID=A0A0N0NRI5_9EURO|nr:uncharacterized protein AB675_2328 [Phialophora attinorum]KPI44889.1 hypothetical protein AB675_2328 [Phialophora attinorum]
MSTQQEIYTGIWVNWSYGKVHGSTITLSPEGSAYFIAFIALFVRLVGSHLWTNIAFTTSLIRSSRPRDGLYHQQQAILRNSSSPASVTWDTLKLAWFWNGSAPGAKSRTLTFAFFSLSYIIAFTAAGIFSSKISSTNSEVLLVSGQNCGLWDDETLGPAPDYSSSAYQAWQFQGIRLETNINQAFRSAHSYVSQCHDSNGTVNVGDASCLPLGRETIAWTSQVADCPFDTHLCIADAIQFDSGFINSHTHLGINAGSEDRIEYRRVTTCAPITTEGHVSNWVNATEAGFTIDDGGWMDGETLLKYAYGQNYLFSNNTTFAYSNYTWGFLVGYWSEPNIYKLDIEISLADPNNPNSLAGATFTALPTLSREDADTVLVFLSINGTSLVRIDDPWLKYTTEVEAFKVNSNGTTTPTMTMYRRNAPVNVVACAEQHQLRNPRTGATSRLGGMEVNTYPVADSLGFNQNQLLTYNRSFVVGSKAGLTSVLYNLGGSALLANANQYGLTTTNLSSKQWQIEFDHFFGVSLNSLQLW